MSEVLKRLPNGLTPEQDAAIDRLAQALAQHYWDEPDCPGCMVHPTRQRTRP